MVQWQNVPATSSSPMTTIHPRLMLVCSHYRFLVVDTHVCRSYDDTRPPPAYWGRVLAIIFCICSDQQPRWYFATGVMDSDIEMGRPEGSPMPPMTPGHCEMRSLDICFGSARSTRNFNLVRQESDLGRYWAYPSLRPRPTNRCISCRASRQHAQRKRTF
ncbi:hypothetical protein CC80DRAFT_254755 [Byssothecium circinans]|uniref:Uncharacterized protein n=1 Tax=Byssothecium circinans TaxID=147558 RepID=A0A6A5TBT0_9PLEO|nr:hypothetical protein CC80DRAFT_254755 [Byssothecium circinans]